MRLAARGRIFLARHRWTYWLALVAIAVGLGVVTNGRLVALDSARNRWVETKTVHVARRDPRPDEPLMVDALELPIAAIPPSALTAPPDELVARRHISTGEILVEVDVMSVGGPAARAEPGTVVVGVADGPTSSASIGVRVRVASDGMVLAPDGIVVAVSDEIVFVAVDDEVGAMVAHAARRGTASLMFVP